MPVTIVQRDWLLLKHPEFITHQIAETTRDYLPGLYAEFLSKWPCIPTTAQVAGAGGFEAALKINIDAQIKASQPQGLPRRQSG